MSQNYRNSEQLFDLPLPLNNTRGGKMVTRWGCRATSENGCCTITHASWIVTYASPPHSGYQVTVGHNLRRDRLRVGGTRHYFCD